MPYNTKEIITDSKKQPVPQYFNPKTDQYEVIQGKDGANSFLQKGTVAEEAWEGNSDITQTFPKERYGFSIVNDGTQDLSFIINGQTRKVKPGEAYYSLFNAFTSVTILTTSVYRAEVLS